MIRKLGSLLKREYIVYLLGSGRNSWSSLGHNHGTANQPVNQHGQYEDF